MVTGPTMWKNWPELIALVVLIIGFIIAISLENPWFVYIVIFLVGLMAGRLFFLKLGRQPIFPFLIIIIGFLLGYLLGTFPTGANNKAVAILFFIGWIISHIAHKKAWIPSLNKK